MGNICVKSNQVGDTQLIETKKKSQSSHNTTESSSTIFELESDLTASKTGFFTTKKDGESHFHRVFIERTKEEEERGKLQQLIPMTSFLPTHLIKHIVAKTDRKRVSFSNRETTTINAEEIKEEACILFIDIKGFTNLTESLAEHRHGAEKLSRIVNTFFKKLVAKVIEYGGDVERFAGDAMITVFWSKSDGLNLREATMRALLCAYDITRDTKLRRYKISNKSELTLHVGLSAGECQIYHIGGIRDTYWRLVHSKALKEVGTAIEESNDGEIVIGANTYPLIETAVKAQSIVNSENYLFEEYYDIPPPKPVIQPIRVSKEHEALMRYFIDQHSLEILDTNQADTIFLSGIKQASIVFITMKIKKETNLEVWTQFMEQVQIAIQHYEGTIGNFLQDEKGVLLFCAFGHPKVHQNDAYRAAKFAIDLQNYLTGNEYFEFGIGITTGKVFLGTCGSNDRRDFSVLGDSVNLAARLMKISLEEHNGAPIIDSTTADQNKLQINMTNLEQVKVKGKSDMIDVMKIDGERGEFQYQSELNEETFQPTIRIPTLNSIANSVMKWCNTPLETPVYNPKDSVKTRGYPHLIFVEGKRGYGKTHLFKTFALNMGNHEYKGVEPSNYFYLQSNDLSMSHPYQYFSIWFTFSVCVKYIADAKLDLNPPEKLEDWVALLKMYENFSSKQKREIIKSVFDEEDHQFLHTLNIIFNTGFKNEGDEMDEDDYLRCQTEMCKKFLIQSIPYVFRETKNKPLVMDGKEYKVDPVVCVLEDLQYLDEHSMRLFKELFLGLPNIINRSFTVIVSCNKSIIMEKNKRSFIERVEKEAHEKYVLHSLTLDEAEKLVMDECSKTHPEVESVSIDLVKFILKKSGGNPQIAALFLEKLFEKRYIALDDDEKILQIRENRRELMVQESLPDSIATLEQQRIDSLDPNSRILIKIASTIGMKFSIESLETVVPKQLTAARNVPFHVNTLVTRGFVRPTKDKTFDGKKLFAFSNVVTRDVCYETLLLETRQTIHGELANRYVDTYMLKRKTEGYQTVDASDLALTVALEKTAYHYANSTAVVENKPYTERAISIIRLVSQYYCETNQPKKEYRLLRALYRIIQNRDDYDEKKQKLLFEAVGPLCRATYKNNLDEKTRLEVYTISLKTRKIAQELGLTTQPEFYMMICYEWTFNNFSGKNVLCHELVKDIQRYNKDDAFHIFITSTLGCLTSYGLAEFDDAHVFYQAAYKIYKLHAEDFFKKSKSYTFFQQDFGVMYTLFGGRAAFLSGNHVLADHIMQDVMDICRKRDQSTGIFGAIFSLYQLVLTSDSSLYDFHIDFAQNLIDSMDFSKRPANETFFVQMFELYKAYQPVLNPSSSIDALLASFEILEKTTTSDDFDANQIFHYMTLSAGIAIVKKYLPIRDTYILDRLHCQLDMSEVLQARSLLHRLTSLSDTFASSHQQHIIGLIYVLKGMISLLSYLVDSVFACRSSSSCPLISGLSSSDASLFLPLSDKRLMESRIWIDRGLSVAIRQGSKTIECIARGAKLKFDLICFEHLSSDHVQEDFNLLNHCLHHTLDPLQLRGDLPFIRDIRTVLKDAKQVLRVYQILAVLKSSNGVATKHRLNISHVFTISDFKSSIMKLLALDPSSSYYFTYQDPDFDEILPLSSLSVLPTKAKFFISPLP